MMMCLVIFCAGCYSFPRPMTLSGVIVDDPTGLPIAYADFSISRGFRTSFTEKK